VGKLIRFPLARRLAHVGSGARVFEAVYEEERALTVARRAVVQALSVAVLLTTVLQVLSLTA
jgi:hypothetical protein